VLSDIPAHTDDRVLVDFRTADDAGVFRWESGPALVQTVDFFTPIVDDPYVYGQIAAANAVSDVYAMGGRPLTALAIAAMPKDGLEPHTIRDIFRGGFDKLREAGVALLGGHTIQDQEIKFGYAVTGAIDPARVLTNAGAQPGDVLFLTKPVGTGIVGTAIKFERAPAAVMRDAIASMRTLNRAAAEALQALPGGAVHACTDITGFGLAGHASEMASASGVTLRIALARVPIFAGLEPLVARNRPGGLGTNVEHFGPGVRAGDRADAPAEPVPDGWWPLFDPQTSGGLLVAASAEAADAVEAALTQAGVAAPRIGRAQAAISGVQILVWP
jgi:selenide, water dikinase